jgi:hypothetical protein
MKSITFGGLSNNMLAIFRKKESAISEGRFHNFIESLKLHLNSIKLFNSTVEHKMNIIENKHDELDFRHANNAEAMRQWIEYFNRKHMETDQKINVLATYSVQLKESMEKNREMDEEFIKKVIDDYVEIPKVDKDRLKHEILQELSFMKNNLKNEPKERIVIRTAELSDNILTNSEKWLLNILFNINGPVTYEQIVSRTGKSLNTIRVYMNSLKNKGDLVEESTLPNGSKVFSISNKERAKKLYNTPTM